MGELLSIDTFSNVQKVSKVNKGNWRKKEKMEKIHIIKEYREYAENLIFLENRENFYNMKLREYNKRSKNLGIDASVDQF